MAICLVLNLMAFCCGRNVRDYLPVLARRMADEGVSLVYIDNGSDDGSAQLANEEAFALLELPSDLLNSWRNQLQAVLLETLADIFGTGEDATNIAQVGKNLRPHPA